MEHNKKIGSITMAIAVILSLTSLAFSDSSCFPGSSYDESIIKWVMYCLHVALYEAIPGNQFASHLYIETKYLLLIFASLFLLGALWFKGALSAPFNTRSSSSNDQN